MLRQGMAAHWHGGRSGPWGAVSGAQQLSVCGGLCIGCEAVVEELGRVPGAGLRQGGGGHNVGMSALRACDY